MCYLLQFIVIYSKKKNLNQMSTGTGKSGNFLYGNWECLIILIYFKIKFERMKPFPFWKLYDFSVMS